MPLYSYKCPSCGNADDVLKPIALLDRAEPCYVCQIPMERQVSAPRIVADYAGYECPVSGAWIEGRKAHRENLARTGCRVLEPGETNASHRRAADSLEKLSDSMAETAAEFVETLPTRKREQLISELDHGVDVSFTRQGV